MAGRGSGVHLKKVPGKRGVHRKGKMRGEREAKGEGKGQEVDGRRGSTKKQRPGDDGGGG